jgi:stage V sporulation protein AD
MAKRIGSRTVELGNTVGIAAFSAVVGPKEKQGPLNKFFDKTYDDEFLGEDSFEKAESKLQQQSVKTTLEKARVSGSDVDVIYAGDLLNQCMGTTFGIRELGIPFVGMYGACSTMAQTLAMASLFVDGGLAERVVAVTSSHFCSAERQFRFPLEYGSLRAPTSQWTVTGAGAAIVGEGNE